MVGTTKIKRTTKKKNTFSYVYKEKENARLAARGGRAGQWKKLPLSVTLAPLILTPHSYHAC
jgi:hypothetical protein